MTTFATSGERLPRATCASGPPWASSSTTRLDAANFPLTFAATSQTGMGLVTEPFAADPVRRRDFFPR